MSGAAAPLIAIQPNENALGKPGSGGGYSNFQYTTTPERLISGIAESSYVSITYPGALTQASSYNNLNQLTNLSGQALSWDANGNLLGWLAP